MPNSAIKIPLYVAKDGQPLIGAAAQMEFDHLMTLDGVDKSASAPAITEIGGGWYAFELAYATAPFDAGDLVGVIDADKDGANDLTDAERLIPVEARLDYYGLARLVNQMSQNKTTGDMQLKDQAGSTILQLAISDSDQSFSRTPGAGS